VDKVTDLSGRFPRGTGTRTNGTMSDGERHNIELETRKRLVRQLAQRLNALARTQPAERWFLAASREINHQLLEELDPQLRAKIQKVVPADLTKVERAVLLQHF
jgi:transcription termination factor NusB